MIFFIKSSQISGCVGESSNAMLISLSGTASQLDTIASNQINQDRANALHQSATSLQLAAWIMAQLQSSVHAIYSPEGICGEGESSTTKILGSLSNAITGYIPIVAMLGNQVTKFFSGGHVSLGLLPFLGISAGAEGHY